MRKSRFAETHQIHLDFIKPGMPTSYCQMWCMAVRSSSDLIVSCLLNTIFEIDSSYDLFQVIEAT